MFLKKCPCCNRQMKYKRKNALIYSIKNNCKCNSCANRETINKILSDPIKSDIYRKKLSDSSKGIKITWGDKISKTLTGRKLPKERVEKMKISMLGKNNPFYGKKHTEETKRKLRLKRIKYLNDKFGGGICPTYNPIACLIIDEYGKKHGYNFQHAINGGEHYIKELGYWVDGYDKEKNVVIEYYEKFHSKPKAIIHDENRKNEIKLLLKCDFIEIKEW